MALYLPANFLRSQVVRNYVFGHNKTHSALVIDYGSLLNHHESANTKAVTTRGIFRFVVRRGFKFANRNVLKK